MAALPGLLSSRAVAAPLSFGAQRSASSGLARFQDCGFRFAQSAGVTAKKAVDVPLLRQTHGGDGPKCLSHDARGLHVLLSLSSWTAGLCTFPRIGDKGVDRIPAELSSAREVDEAALGIDAQQLDVHVVTHIEAAEALNDLPFRHRLIDAYPRAFGRGAGDDAAETLTDA